MLEVIKAHEHQLPFCEFLWAYKGKFAPPCDEFSDLLVLFLLSLDKLWDSNPPLGAAAVKGIYVPLPEANNRISGILAYHMMTAPSSDCKNCNNSASFVAGRPFIKGPHCKMKWVMSFFGYPVTLNILISDILKFEGNDTYSTQACYMFGDSRGHLGFFLLLVHLLANQVTDIGYDYGAKS